MTLYQSKYGFFAPKAKTLAQALASEMNGSDYVSGQVETLDREVSLLQNMILRIVGVLSEKQKLEVLGDSWERAE